MLLPPFHAGETPCYCHRFMQVRLHVIATVSGETPCYCHHSNCDCKPSFIWKKSPEISSVHKVSFEDFKAFPYCESSAVSPNEADSRYELMVYLLPVKPVTGSYTYVCPYPAMAKESTTPNHMPEIPTVLSSKLAHPATGLRFESDDGLSAEEATTKAEPTKRRMSQADLIRAKREKQRARAEVIARRGE